MSAEAVLVRHVRGFTLIEALVALAILAVALAAAMRPAGTVPFILSPEPISLRRVEDLVARAHADSLARAATERAVAVLAADDPRVDHLAEPWALPLPARPAGSATLDGRIADEQAKFNLNNLVRGEAPSPADVAVLQRLLELAGLPGSLADAIVDWLDPDDAPAGPARVEAHDDLVRTSARRGARRELADVGELAQVEGMTHEALARLAPYVTALPDETPVNVNTASATVLRALVPALSGADAARIVEARGHAPFAGREAFLRALPDAGPAAASVDVKSRFFRAEATVRVGRAAIGYRALIERGERRGAVIVALTQIAP